MSKYVSIEKLQNGDVQIVLDKIPGSKRAYQIFFDALDCPAEQFFTYIRSESKLLCDTSIMIVLAGSLLYIKFKNIDNKYNPQYKVVLEKSKWVDEHFDSIKSQLLAQAREIEYDVECDRNVKEIEQAIHTKNYSTLIQNMIKQYANELTDIEVMEIQSTLTTVKESKGLTPRQTYKFGL